MGSMAFDLWREGYMREVRERSRPWMTEMKKGRGECACFVGVKDLTERVGE
jgi:hypothetical protein